MLHHVYHFYFPTSSKGIITLTLSSSLFLFVLPFLFFFFLFVCFLFDPAVVVVAKLLMLLDYFYIIQPSANSLPISPKLISNCNYDLQISYSHEYTSSVQL
mmetsp:Transcript_10309/g.13643  ORF Transcript_10309/g.13643 Transcript_10309/m.13643 type:complete len:101 (-) Transcript_10309:214-516(-)